MARRGQQTKDAQLAIRFTDSQIKRLTELAAALGSDNLSGAVRWAVERAPNPSTQRAKPGSSRRQQPNLQPDSL